MNSLSKIITNSYYHNLDINYTYSELKFSISGDNKKLIIDNIDSLISNKEYFIGFKLILNSDENLLF